MFGGPFFNLLTDSVQYDGNLFYTVGLFYNPRDSSDIFES